MTPAIWPDPAKTNLFCPEYNLVASNTEAALVARAEGKTPENLNRLVGQIKDALAGAGLTWKQP